MADLTKCGKVITTCWLSECAMAVNICVCMCVCNTQESTKIDFYSTMQCHSNIDKWGNILLSFHYLLQFLS